MSADASLILDVTPAGDGLALDLAGGRGMMRQPLQRLGYRYVNLDIEGFGNGEPTVVGDAHALPFADASFDLVICKEALTNFARPWMAVNEVHRVLRPGGLFIISAGFMWPYSYTDYYRYTPLGLRHLLGDFEITRLESPHGVFTMLSALIVQIMRRLRLGVAEVPIKRLCHGIDRRAASWQRQPSSFAAGYRLVARKPAVAAGGA